MNCISIPRAALKAITTYPVLVVAILFLTQSCKKAGDPIKLPSIVTTSTLPKTANLDKLTLFKAFQTSKSTPYDLAVIGDSYVQGNYFTNVLRNKFLTDGFLDGGPGYCSFGRSDGAGLALDASVDPSQLTFSYDPLLWDVNQENTIGPCGDVKNNANNATITVTSTVALNTMTIVYEKHAGAGNYQYRLNGGAWTIVNMAAAAQSIENLVLNTSAAGKSITLEIQPLSTGEIFCGVIGRNSGNAVTVHKVGMAGGIAIFFAQNDLWRNSTALLNPKGFVVLFGTNEMELNISPADFKTSIEYIINRLREINPNADIILACPPETLYETEQPRKYKIADYGDVLNKLAIANNLAFVNFAAIFPHFSQASVDQGYMDADRKQPGTKGGELIAQTLHDALAK